MTKKRQLFDFIHRLYLESVYKLLFYIFVMSRKRSGYPEVTEKTGFLPNPDLSGRE